MRELVLPTIRTNEEYTIENRVSDGAAFLDSFYPGWQDEIDCNRLFIASAFDCVLGQLMSVYDDAVLDLQDQIPGLQGDWQYSYGFCAKRNATAGTWNECSQLTAEWRRIIIARQ